MIGKNLHLALGTLVERKTRFTLVVRTKNRTARQVRCAFGRALKGLPEALRKSLTYDHQGREMAEHPRLTQDTRVQVYFAHPASPWERGTNEKHKWPITTIVPERDRFQKGNGVGHQAGAESTEWPAKAMSEIRTSGIRI